EKQEKSSVFLSDSKFMQDLSSADFSKKTVGGPYKDVGKTIFVEFQSIDIGESKPVEANTLQANRSQELLMTFLEEIEKSIGKAYPIVKNNTKQKQAN
ncbi:MAG: hypothetical protein AAF518_18065, partial [Spirochaetota bacterium]